MENFKARLTLGQTRYWLEIKHNLTQDEIDEMYKGWFERTKVFTSYSFMRYIEKRLPERSCINLGYGRKTKKF